MRIALLHYSCSPIIGGVEQIIESHARILLDNGHAVSLIVGTGEVSDSRIPVRVLPELNSRGRIVDDVKLQLDRGEVTALFHSLREDILEKLTPILSEFDQVIAHNVCSLHKNLALTAALHEIALRQPDKFIFWQHDFAWSAERYKSEMHLGYPWDLTSTVPSGVTIVTISESRKEELCRVSGVSPEAVQVVSQGVDLFDFVTSSAETRELFDPILLTESFPLMVLPVRITRRKNLSFALDVMELLVRSFPQAHLIITGPLGSHNSENVQYFNELLGRVESLSLKDHVKFGALARPTGLMRETVIDLLNLSDILFLPSTEEGFGLPLLEAGATKTPIVCSDIPVFRAVTGGFAQFFNPYKDPAQAVAAIERAIEQDVVKARRWVKESYGLNVFYRNYLEPLLKGVSTVD